MAGVPRLPPLPNMREILTLYKLRAVKQLSQNFLMDPSITNKLVKIAGGKRSLRGSYVCEVGPGPGSITRAILQRGVSHLTVIEKDRRFLPGLEMLQDACTSNGAMTIHLGDVLRFDMSNIFPEEAAKPWDEETPNIYIIGNLPFGVATPLIIKWLKQVSERSGAWRYGRVEMVLTFQREVGERMVSRVSESQRTRLSIMTQYLCEVSHNFTIKSGAFIPPPEVEAAVMHFVPRKEPLIPVPFDHVEKLVRHVFSFRQKHCKRGLRTLFPPDRTDLVKRILVEADINPEKTSFLLTMKEFRRLCVVYKQICDENPELSKYNHRSSEEAKVWRSSANVPRLEL